jgi:hypothetical protein
MTAPLDSNTLPDVQRSALALTHGSAGLIVRLRALAADDRYAWDDWSEGVLRQAANEIERLVRSKDRMKQSRGEYMRLYHQARNALPFSWSPPNDQISNGAAKNSHE